LKEIKKHCLEQEAHLTEYNKEIQSNKELKKTVNDAMKEKSKQDKSKISSKFLNQLSTVTVNSQIETNRDFETIKNENMNLKKEVFDLKKIIDERDKLIRT
jgi:polyphosphate kinase